MINSSVRCFQQIKFIKSHAYSVENLIEELSQNELLGTWILKLSRFLPQRHMYYYLYVGKSVISEAGNSSTISVHSRKLLTNSICSKLKSHLQKMTQI